MIFAEKQCSLHGPRKDLIKSLNVTVQGLTFLAVHIQASWNSKENGNEFGQSSMRSTKAYVAISSATETAEIASLETRGRSTLAALKSKHDDSHLSSSLLFMKHAKHGVAPLKTR